MKKSISALILMLFLPALAFAQLQWAEPWEKALDEANKAKKPVFFDFTPTGVPIARSSSRRPFKTRR